MSTDWLATRPERWRLSPTYLRVAEVIGFGRAVDLGMILWDANRFKSRKVPVGRGRAAVLYVPSRHRGPGVPPAKLPKIYRFASYEDAGRLIQAFRGERLEFVCIEAMSIPARNRSMAEQFAQLGMRDKQLAALYGLTPRQVRRILATQRPEATESHVH